jgi:hypothetical protein
MELAFSHSEPAAPSPNPRTGEVRTSLTFGLPQGGPASYLSVGQTGNVRMDNYQTEDHPVTVRNMRPLTGALSLDRQGFELHGHSSKVGDLYDDTAIFGAYDREIEDLLIAATGADRVAVFDRTRRSDAPDGAANADGQRGPATRVHVDYTVKSGPQRARDILGGAEVDRILATGGRIMQVNVWRPIKGPIQRSPLALADPASVEPADLLPTARISTDRISEIYRLDHGPAQKWYWVPEMRRDEVLLIKGWDSIDDGRARFTPHSAFDLPDQNPDAPARESIEVRTYLDFEGPVPEGDHND